LSACPTGSWDFASRCDWCAGAASPRAIDPPTLPESRRTVERVCAPPRGAFFQKENRTGPAGGWCW
jgi:hypothetical protein